MDGIQHNTSSFKPGDNIEDPNPEVNCTSKLSPKRLPRKKNEFPSVVISCMKKKCLYEKNIVKNYINGKNTEKSFT
jgi:ribosomal protein L19